MSFSRLSFLLILVWVGFCLSGCGPKRVSTLCTPPVSGEKEYKPALRLPYHIVSEGETLWRICKNYGVSMQDVIDLNHISDPTKIEVGQKIYLPVKKKRKEVSFKFADRYSGPTERSFSWPVKGSVVLFYGQCKDGWVNKGIDIKATNSDVICPKTGKVVFVSDNLRGYGFTVMIDHGDGYISVIAGQGKGLVNLGEVVKKGSPVMRVAPHSIVHYELRKNARAVNPLKYLR